MKNLGHWLGMQTLAKNKAILQNVRFIPTYMYMYILYTTCMHLCILYVREREREREREKGIDRERQTEIERLCLVYMCMYSMQDLAVKDLVREAHYKGEKVDYVCCNLYF